MVLEGQSSKLILKLDIMDSNLVVDSDVHRIRGENGVVEDSTPLVTSRKHRNTLYAYEADSPTSSQ